MTTPEHINQLLKQLSDENLERVRDYVEYLQWQQSGKPAGRPWSYDFVEHFGEAESRSERETAGLEVKAADAICGGVSRAALWEHPPISGAARISYVVPIPPKLRGLKLLFAIGIRDGAELPSDRYVAFRVAVNDWKMWSAVKNSHRWDEYQVPMPELASDIARIEFMTDGLGYHRWNWAVWGEPRLVAESEP